MSLTRELQQIGLSEKEAKVYIATLELGQDSVQNISKKSGVNRATTYSILEALISKGLSSTFEQAKKTYYIATAPDNLLSMFEMEKVKIEEKRKNFEKLLPNLRSRHNTKAGKPTVRFYEGKQGMISCLDDFSIDHKTYPDEPMRIVFDRDRIRELFSDEERSKFINIRTKRKVPSKGIYSSKNETLKKKLDKDLIVKLNNKNYPLTCELAVFGDNFRIISLGKDLSGVLIKNKEIATTMKTIIDLAFQTALQMFVKEKKKEKGK
ncbi:hypothetical protein HQ571_06240 [Candidatus Kuenenbacteria bacterium]|nr:hypothetical protein [Candidatus Kuenenbacteria bacterium]